MPYDIVPLSLASQESNDTCNDTWLEGRGLGCIDVDIATGRAFSYWHPGRVEDQEAQDAAIQETIEELIAEGE